MRVPLVTSDFLDRAVLAYGRRTGLVDEPAPFQDGGLGSLTYGELGGRARALAAGLDELGVGVGERVAVVSHNSARLMELLLAGTASGRVVVPDQLPAQPRRGRLHRRALRRQRAAGRPRAGRPARRRAGEAPLRAGRGVRRGAAAAGRGAGAVGAGRGRHRHDQLHQRDDRPPQGRADHAPQHLDQRRHLRPARRRHRPRRLPAHPADVPLQRLGDAVRDDRDGRPAGRASARSTAPRSCAGSSATASR